MGRIRGTEQRHLIERNLDVESNRVVVENFLASIAPSGTQR